ncbi:hypothetical protein [Altererythrobacter lutimaris]|uniref:DUF1579 domain-containing protein n=1 Tax=Altererythrobacter lutimaris TaxID=2743979 RepID=A0A850H982_9SPHN|nr:hypothetical protein [Altererythrobacter lutimaris]NVE94060.1 hypothetical protein [Altererythrobacter lutimaris]
MKRLAALLCVSALLGTATSASAEAERHDFPFERFLGHWALKDDRFQQVWDGKTVETLSIPGHRTHCKKVNTRHSVLCEVDAVDFQGHILWAIDAEGSEVHHLSHFGTARLGHGFGELSPQGDMRLRIRFSDEPDGTYRVYDYRWLSETEYEMISRQYDCQGQPTGNWYGGTFIRIESEG